MSLSRLWELVMDREACCDMVHGVSKSWTEWLNWTELNILFYTYATFCWSSNDRHLFSLFGFYEWCCYDCLCACVLSHVQLFVTLWTLACYVPLSMEFSRQEYWIVLAFPSLWDLPKPETKSASPALVGKLFTTEPPGLPFLSDCTVYNTSGTETIYHRLGLEPTCWDSNPAKTHSTWFQDLMKLRFLSWKTDNKMPWCFTAERIQWETKW